MEEISYSGIHCWIRRERGVAKNYTCEQCKKKPALDWSNIDHKYSRDLSDWRALCRKCHQDWDREMLGIKYGERAQLPEDIIKKMIEEYKVGDITYKQLAKKYNIHYRAVGYHCRNSEGFISKYNLSQ